MPDLVIINGRVITFDGPDMQAIAVKDGVIVDVGSDEQIRAIAGDARIIDAQGNTVLPGFIDSHVHIFNGSAELEYLNLYGVFGIEQLAERIREYAASRPDDQVLFGCGLEYALIDGRSATRHDLDKASPDRPFAAMAADHHTTWANTQALELAGILQGGEAGDGAEIVMDSDGTATGEMREFGAFASVLALTPLGGRDGAGIVTGQNPVPTPTAAEREVDKRALANGMKHCAQYGITSLHNMDGNFYQLELLAEMEAEGTLLCRIEVPLHLKPSDPLDRIDEAAEMRARFNSDMVWSSRVKMFMDGVIDSKTAYMLDPYPGTDSRSEALFGVDHFNEACTRIDAMGLQIAVHAIGDAAVRQTLDGFEAAQQTNGVRDSRHRVEHIETIRAEDIPRFKQLGVVASMQPLHSPAGGFFGMPYDSNTLLHESQIATAFPNHTLRETGATVVFSTDWPVVPVDVMATIQGVVSPVSLPDGWTDQRETLRDTLASYTRDNAWVEFNEHRKGRLKVGMMADIVVMDHDLDAMDPATLGTARAAVTICGGRITHQA